MFALAEPDLPVAEPDEELPTVEAPWPISEPPATTLFRLCQYMGGGIEERLPMCGRPTAGKVYCAEHHALCWQVGTATQQLPRGVRRRRVASDEHGIADLLKQFEKR